jgi:SAM-dependent methyltransferase
VRHILQEVVREIDPTVLDGLDPSQEAAALGTIQAFFRQACDLLDNPGRAPGWTYDDPTVLQAQGQLSRMGVRGIEKLAALRPGLQETLRQPGAFLDVGTGVGWLAIEAARCWPALRVVGIDPWDRALALARENVAATGMGSRVELRSQRVELLPDIEAFTLAWLPGPFLSPDIVTPGVQPAGAQGRWLAGVRALRAAARPARGGADRIAQRARRRPSVGTRRNRGSAAVAGIRAGRDVPGRVDGVGGRPTPPRPAGRSHLTIGRATRVAPR